MKAIGCVILSFFALAGCGPILPNTPSMVVRTYPFNPAGKMILIQYFDFSPAVATNVDRPSVEKFGELIAFDIQKYLKRTGFKNPLVVRAKEPSREISSSKERSRGFQGETFNKENIWNCSVSGPQK